MADHPEENRAADELAGMVESMARSAHVDRVLCITETGLLFRTLRARGADLAVTPATPDPETFDCLAGEGFDPVRLSVRVTDKYGQARHTIARALQEGQVATGDRVLCVVGHFERGGGGDLVLVTEVERSADAIGLAEMVRLAEGVQPQVLEAAVRIGCRIGRIAGRGRSVGALFLIGDSDRVMEGATQLVPNPFENGPEAGRRITSAAVEDSIIELAKLDGAFVLRGDGVIRSAGSYLTTRGEAVDLPQGLGARHMAGAAVTARTRATAVVVSATDGHVRVFVRGRLALHVDSDVHVQPGEPGGEGG